MQLRNLRFYLAQVERVNPDIMEDLGTNTLPSIDASRIPVILGDIYLWMRWFFIICKMIIRSSHTECN